MQEMMKDKLVKDRAALLDVLAKYWKDRKDLNVVEVGVFLGEYADVIRQKLDREALRLWLVDLWSVEGNQGYFATVPGELADAYSKVLDRYGTDQKVTLLKMSSAEASKQFPDQTFDLIYLDADHTFASVFEDIKLWLPKLKKGGFIAGHDFNPDLSNSSTASFGVNQAVNAFFGDRIRLTGEKSYQTWYFQKEW